MKEPVKDHEDERPRIWDQPNFGQVFFNGAVIEFGPGTGWRSHDCEIDEEIVHMWPVPEVMSK